MATLHSVRIDLPQHPKAYHPQVGDVVQCTLDFAVTPGTDVSDIQVAIKQPVIKEIGVILTSAPGQMGGGQISAFLYAESKGLCHVRFTPMCNGKPLGSYEVTFLMT